MYILKEKKTEKNSILFPGNCVRKEYFQNLKFNRLS